MNNRTFTLAMLSAATVALLFVLAFTPGGGKGHGPVKSETRTVSTYTGIKAGGAFEIDVTQSASTGLTIEAPDDVLPDISTEVNGGVLTIKFTKEVNNLQNSVKVHLQTASLNMVDISGASTLDMKNNFTADHFQLKASGAAVIKASLKTKKTDIDASGAAQLDIDGSADECSADVSGASHINAEKFTTVKTTVDVSGASSLDMNVTQSISGSATGASSIHYKGNPATKNVTASGASSVHGN